MTRWSILKKTYTNVSNISTCCIPTTEVSITRFFRAQANETLIGELADMAVMGKKTSNLYTQRHQAGNAAAPPQAHTQQSTVEVITVISLPLSPVKMLSCPSRLQRTQADEENGDNRTLKPNFSHLILFLKNEAPLSIRPFFFPFSFFKCEWH